jgi:hypothetical protein
MLMKRVSVVGIHVDKCIVIARQMRKHCGNGWLIVVTRLVKLSAGFVGNVQNITAASRQQNDEV